MGIASLSSIASNRRPIQGATAKDVGVLDGHWSVYKEAAYTAITRAAERLRVFTDRESLGIDGTDTDRTERLARRWKRSQERRASIHFAKSDLPIALDPPGPALSPCPRLAEVVRGAVVDRDRTDLPDPLEPYRSVLGKRRAADIERAAEELVPEMADLDDTALDIERARTKPALDALDRHDARLALRIERDHRIVQDQVHATLEEAKALQARAQATGALGHSERRDLMQAAKVQRQIAERDEEALAKLVETERHLRKQGRHLDNWVADHAYDAARWVAAEREHAMRRELSTETPRERPISRGRVLGGHAGPPERAL